MQNTYNTTKGKSRLQTTYEVQIHKVNSLSFENLKSLLIR